jgi:deazaflavin-dependent oxidoreductase (nitroreductase family)
MYLPHDTDPDTIYVFATKGGLPTNPDWYYNLTAAGDGSVERGTETYKVTVRELTGAERDRIYAEQARRYPGFADRAHAERLESAPFPVAPNGDGHEPYTQRPAGEVLREARMEDTRHVDWFQIAFLVKATPLGSSQRGDLCRRTALREADMARESLWIR